MTPIALTHSRDAVVFYPVRSGDLFLFAGDLDEVSERAPTVLYPETFARAKPCHFLFRTPLAHLS